MSVNEKMTAIADAIRDKTGGTDALSLDAMATEIPKVYEEGKKVGAKEFMRIYQESAAYSQNGQSRLFAGVGWNDDTFFPVMDIDMSAQNVFHYFGWGQNSKKVDLIARLRTCGVKLDFTNGLGTASFSYAWVTTVPKLIISSRTSLTDTFRGAKVLVTIEELAFPEENTFTFSRTFDSCLALEDITITGTISSSVDFSDCSKLTVKSMKSVIEALANYAGTDKEGANTLSFSSNCWTNLEADSTAPDGGTWKNYVETIKGWSY